MKKIKLLVTLVLISLLTTLTGCHQKPVVDGSFDFIIYESDSNNNDLSDNKIVVKYTIDYVNCQTVTDALIKKGDKYYFTEKSKDYLVLVNGPYGLSYTEGYFENYHECENNTVIDISWSYTAVNGTSSTYGISETPLDGLKEYGFVINGWK